MNPFLCTRPVLATYEQTEKDRYETMMAAANDDAVIRAMIGYEWALAILRLAFYADTHHVNGPQHAAVADVAFITRCVVNAQERDR